MTMQIAISLGGLIVGGLGVAFGFWSRLSSHGDAQETANEQRDANDLKRYELLQRDVDLAREAADRAEIALAQLQEKSATQLRQLSESTSTEIAALRGRVVALEAAADERERVVATMGRQISALTEDNRLLRVKGGGA